jgi:hypothetical protein
MNPPAGSIKTELNDAVVGGIRQRGPDAVGLVIVGIARLIVGVATLGVLLGIGAIFGYDATAAHFAGLTGVSALVSWLVAGRSGSPRRRGRP